MIQGKRVDPQEYQRVVRAPNPAANDPGEVRVERALFFDEPGYGQHVNGVWFVKPPGGDSRPIDPKVHEVTEDKKKRTITVKGPPFITKRGAFELKDGFFVEVA